MNPNAERISSLRAALETACKLAIYPATSVNRANDLLNEIHEITGAALEMDDQRMEENNST